MEPVTITELQDLIGRTRQRPVETTNASGIAELPSRDILLSLYQVCPSAAFFTSIPPLSEETTHSSEVLPPFVSSLIDETIDLNTRQCEEIWNAYENVITPESCARLEITRSQAVCPSWYQHRKGRITGSKVHGVLVRRNSTPPENVKEIMGYRTYNLSRKKAVMWGIENEEKARNTYIKVQREHHSDLEVRMAGFMIDSKRPYYGVSPDGLCQCSCCGKGCIEIKCPFKFRESTIAQAFEDPNFCLDGNMNLKRSHRYFAQVQMQMCVIGVSFCDFVTYTKK